MAEEKKRKNHKHQHAQWRPQTEPLYLKCFSSQHTHTHDGRRGERERKGGLWLDSGIESARVRSNIPIGLMVSAPSGPPPKMAFTAHRAAESHFGALLSSLYFFFFFFFYNEKNIRVTVECSFVNLKVE